MAHYYLIFCDNKTMKHEKHILHDMYFHISLCSTWDIILVVDTNSQVWFLHNYIYSLYHFRYFGAYLVRGFITSNQFVHISLVVAQLTFYSTKFTVLYKYYFCWESLLFIANILSKIGKLLKSFLIPLEKIYCLLLFLA